VQWTDLTKEQQCVLLNAVEESFLFEVLTECAPGPDWPEDRLPRIPHIAEIVEDFISRGLVILTRSAPETNQPPVDIPSDRAHDVLADPANWWTPDGTRPFALAATDEGRAIFRA
jgi:hypothetical protein